MLELFLFFKEIFIFKQFQSNSKVAKIVQRINSYMPLTHIPQMATFYIVLYHSLLLSMSFILLNINLDSTLLISAEVCVS